MKSPARLEHSGALERAGCRCHSWVIQEINWGLGWEAASKRTLCSDLPPAPAQTRCQMLMEMLLGAGTACITSASAAPCHILANLSQRGSSPAWHPPVSLKKTPKSNQIKALGRVSPRIRMEAAPSGLDDMGWAALPTHPGRTAGPAPAQPRRLQHQEGMGQHHSLPQFPLSST